MKETFRNFSLHFRTYITQIYLCIDKYPNVCTDSIKQYAIVQINIK